MAGAFLKSIFRVCLKDSTGQMKGEPEKAEAQVSDWQ
jgi:hypothetical protein